MNKGRGFQNGWWLILITLGVMLATELPFAFASSDKYNFIYMLFSEITLIIPIFVGLSFMNLEQSDGRVIENIGLKGFPIKALPFIILLPVTAQYFINYVTLPVQTLLTLLLGGREYSFPSGIENFWQNFVLMCILAPFFEEMLCRGILVNLFKRYGTAKMLVYSSLGFAMLHMDAEAFLPLFFVGLVLGAIRITTGSVLAAMTAHAASNLFSLIAITFNSGFMAHNIIFIILFAVAFPVLLWFYFRKFDGTFRKSDLIRSKTAPTGFSVGFIVVLSAFSLFNIIAFAVRLFSGEFYYDISSMFIY